MTNYSDEKNPFGSSEDNSMAECFGHDAWKDGYAHGYLAGEKARFTEGEKIVMRKLLSSINWDLALGDFDMCDVESLKKKVIGG